VVLGSYYMTRERRFARGEGRVFASPEEVERAYDTGEVDLHARVKVRMPSRPLEKRIVEQLPELQDAHLVVGVDVAGRNEVWHVHRGGVDRFVDEGGPIQLGEFAALGGDAAVVLSKPGRTVEIDPSGEPALYFDLAHIDQPTGDPAAFEGRSTGIGNLEAFRKQGKMVFLSSYQTESVTGWAASQAVVPKKGTVREEQLDDLAVWIYELPEIRGAQRVVATVHPRVATNSAGEPMVDARFNVARRMRQLQAAMALLRENFQDNLTMVVAPGGFFGFDNILPVWTEDHEENVVEAHGELVDTTVGRVMFYSIVPSALPFSLVDRPMSKKALGELIDRCYRRTTSCASGSAWRPKPGSPSASTTWRSHIRRPRSWSRRSTVSGRPRPSTTTVSSPRARSTTRWSTSGRR